MDAERREGELLAVAAAGVLAAAVALCLHPIGNNDIWWHLAAGRETVSTGRIPRADVFSFTRQGTPWISHEWLAEVLFWLAFRAGGATALIAIEALAALAAAGIALLACPRGPGPRLLGLLLAPPALWLCAPRLLVRPELFTLVLASAATWIALRSVERPHPAALALPLLVGLWVQLHGAFVLGLGLAALLGGREAWRGLRDAAGRGPALARAGWLLLGSLGAALLNPHGPAILAFPFRLAGSPVFSRQILEWRGPFSSPFRSTTVFPVYLLWLALCAAAVVRLAARRRIVPALWAAGLAALSLRMSRNTALFALGTWPVIALALGSSLERLGGAGRRRAAGAAALAAFALAAFSATVGFPYRADRPPRAPGLGVAGTVPARMADFMEARGYLGDALNTYAFGGYLAFRFFPRVRISIDSRNEVYGESFFQDHRDAFRRDTPLRRRLLREARIACLEPPARDGSGRLHEALAASPDWALVYFDDGAFLYSRADGPRADRVARDAYRLLRPDRLTIEAEGAEGWRHAIEEARRARDTSGDALRARILEGYAMAGLAEALDRAGRREEAQEAFARAAARLEDLAQEKGAPWQVPFNAARAHQRLWEATRAAGRRREAVRLYRRALALEPGAGAARDALRALQTSR